MISSSSPLTRITTLCTTCKSPARHISAVVNLHLFPHLTLSPVCLRDNLYNTNSGFDWGTFRKLEEALRLSWSPPGAFSLVLSQPGVYVFKLSSHPHRHMVKQPFFPNLLHQLTTDPHIYFTPNVKMVSNLSPSSHYDVSQCLTISMSPSMCG